MSTSEEAVTKPDENDDGEYHWYQQKPPAWFARAIVEGLLIFFAMYTAWWIGVRLSDLLVILLAALFVGFAIEPAVNWLAHRGWRRGLATLFVYFGIFLAVAIFIAAFGALVVDQIVSIAQSLPDLVASLADWLKNTFNVDLQTELTKVTGSLSSFGGSIATTALSIGTRIISSIFALFTIALFGFYFAAQGPSLRRNVCSLLPPRSQHEVLRAWEIATNKTAGYLYSRILLAICSAICTTIFLAIIKIPNALTLGIFVGLVSQFVPTVGTYIAGALPVLVALTIDPWKALFVVIFIIAYQQFENYILTPPLSSRTMEIHPAVAFGSVIAGAALIGALGALIALPAAATIQAFGSTFIRRRELVDSPMLDEKPTPDPEKAGIGKSLLKMSRRPDAPDKKSGDKPDAPDSEA